MNCYWDGKPCTCGGLYDPKPCPREPYGDGNATLETDEILPEDVEHPDEPA